MSTDEAAIYDQNPVEYIIPFAQMSLVNGTFLMDIWNWKIEYNQEEGAINLEVRYDEQTWTVNHLRQNLQALETFTTDASSRRWKYLLPDNQRSLRDAEQQVIMLAQKMSYRASMASLRESQMAIEQAKTGIQQNERVKRLPQLAIHFHPTELCHLALRHECDCIGNRLGNGVDGRRFDNHYLRRYHPLLDPTSLSGSDRKLDSCKVSCSKMAPASCTHHDPRSSKPVTVVLLQPGK